MLELALIVSDRRLELVHGRLAVAVARRLGRRDAEEAMLKLYIDRAGIDDNQNILDLGCGWGSFSLYAAAKFPSSKFTAVSNSKDQINFINAEAQKETSKI